MNEAEIAQELRFKQLSKEIVVYVQNNIGKTQRCIDFVYYELNLRTIAKDALAIMAKQEED